MHSRAKHIHRSVMLQELKAAFPELGEAVNQSDGLLHFGIGEFRRLTQSFIDTKNKKELVRSYHLAARFLIFGDRKVSNAIALSYLEDLNFRDGRVSRAWAHDLLPTTLAEEHRALEVSLGVRLT